MKGTNPTRLPHTLTGLDFNKGPLASLHIFPSTLIGENIVKTKISHRHSQGTQGTDIFKQVLFSSLLLVLSAEVSGVQELVSEEEDASKVLQLLNLGDDTHLSDHEANKIFFSRLAGTRESLVNSWKDGTIDRNVDFETINPDITAQPEIVDPDIAKQERTATLEAMRQVFILEKEVADSEMDKNKSQAVDKMSALCRYLVKATRHQIAARKAGDGKVDLRTLPEYEEAVEATKKALDSFSGF